MTYNVLMGTLNPTHSLLLHAARLTNYSSLVISQHIGNFYDHEDDDDDDDKSTYLPAVAQFNPVSLM